MLEKPAMEIKNKRRSASKEETMRALYAIPFVIGCVVLGSLTSAAQQPSHDEHRPGPPPAGGPPPGGMKMDEKCAMMKREMDDMSAGMRAAHERLEKLLREMNTTTGPAKVEAMAAVVNEMVAHSAEMHRMHDEMMHKMMGHMAEHMGMMGMGGGPGAGKGIGMEMCPMMKGHAGEAGGDHSEHAPPPAVKPEKDEHSEHHPPA
jgi:hypothetical protein